MSGSKANSETNADDGLSATEGLFVVGIGASAGGIEAIAHLLPHVPPDTGLAFVVVMHLDPTHASQLVDVLSRSTAMPTCEAANGMPIEGDHVYVISPNKLLHVERGLFQLSPRLYDHVPSLPIDVFFQSLAADVGDRAIGVVLSGTGSDGTLGLQAIKAADGITFAQNDTAQQGGMPRSAVQSGCVDLILPPAEIAAELTRIGRQSRLGRDEGPSDDPPTDENHASKEALAELFRLLRQATPVDYANYKPSTVGRRIQRRLLANRLETIEEYLSFVREHPEELIALHQELLIHVTRFFRDVDAFEALKSQVFPAIVAQRAADSPIRIWIPGCSTGEEVYSLAISLNEFLGERAATTPIKIFATDIGDVPLARARAGIYPVTIAVDVSPERLDRYFVRVENGYQIIRPIRDLCVFARHDMTSEPPFSHLDLISCRNVLIYLGPVLQKRVLPLFHYALKPGRFLFLGGSETVGSLSDLFENCDIGHRIYTTRAVSSRITFDFSSGDAVFSTVSKDAKVTRVTPGLPDLKSEADRLLLNHYAPPGVIVNEGLEILHFRGDTGRYLAPAPGMASFHLLKMAREGLLVDLRAVLDEARAGGQPARRNAVRFRFDGHESVVDLQVIPLQFSNQSCCAVLFEDPSAPRTTPAADQAAIPALKVGATAYSEQDLQLARLNQELEAAKEYLQFNIEKVETANEELRVANEEVISSNEELQSTNEELQTAKEELQASNEELNTVNEELRLRHRDATQLGDDLSNVLRSIDIPIVLVGPDLCVRRFTPRSGEVFRLIASDVGRPIADLNHNLVDVPLKSWIEETLRDSTAVEHEVRDREGRWFRLSVRPYRTNESAIEGAVLTVIDIDEIKRSEQRIVEARDYAEAILGTIQIPLVVLDRQRRIESANAAFFDFFNVTRTETEQRFLKDLGNRQWDLPELDDLLSKTLTTGETLKDYFVRHNFPVIGHKVLLLNASRLVGDGGDGSRVLVAIEDFTQREQAMAVMREERSHESQKMESIGRLAGGIAHDFNNLLTVILGYGEVLKGGKQNDSSSSLMLAAIHEAADRAARLTQQLLAYSRKQTLQLRELDLNPLVAEMGSMLTRLLQENIQIQTHLCREAAMVLVDPGQMEQVLMNLCLNARDAITDSGQIVLETSHVDIRESRRDGDDDIPPGRYVRLSVRDDGIGMDAETLARIFEPFYTTKPFGKGTGLGLATVHGIIRQSQGHIEVTSQPNRGTTFTIHLPAAENRPLPTPDVRAVAEATGRVATILVVDDNAAIRQLVVTLLQSPDRRILEAENGEAALEVCRGYPDEIDLMITDVLMPGMDGYSLAGVLKESRPQLKVLYISGHAEDVVRHLGIGYDQIDFLRKPFSVDVLQKRVAEGLAGERVKSRGG